MKKYIFLILIFVLWFSVQAKAITKEDYLNKQKKMYYEQCFNEKEKLLYEQILNGILNLDDYIETDHVSINLVYNIMLELRADFPEIFWLKEEYRYVGTEDDITGLYLEYFYNSYEEIDEEKAIMDIAISEVKENTKNMNQYDTAKYIFSYVLEHVTYNSQIKTGISVIEAFSFVNSNEEGKAYCFGFAQIYCILAQSCNLDCSIHLGYRTDTSTVMHSWDELALTEDEAGNVLENEILSLYVDCTWGDHTEDVYDVENNKYFTTDKDYFYRNRQEGIITVKENYLTLYKTALKTCIDNKKIKISTDNQKETIDKNQKKYNNQFLQALNFGKNCVSFHAEDWIDYIKEEYEESFNKNSHQGYLDGLTWLLEDLEDLAQEKLNS